MFVCDPKDRNNRRLQWNVRIFCLGFPGCAHWSAERLGDAKECEYVIQESLTYDKQVPYGKIFRMGKISE